MAEPTYIFKNSKVYTIVEGKVVAAVPEDQFDGGGVDSVGQDPVQMPKPPSDIHDDLGKGVGEPCPNCGTPSDAGDAFCSGCGTPVGGDSQDPMGDGGVPGADLYGTHPPERAHAVARTIVTPNGLKGHVMGHHSLWGEEVTVRFENGVIKRLPVSSVTYDDNTGNEPTGVVASLDARLAKVSDSDLESLLARRNELEDIRREARKELTGGSDEDLENLDRITVQADVEQREVDEALSFLGNEEEQSSQALASIDNLPAVEQASMGGNDATWLDKTLGEMRASVEATNFTQLMDEGPEAFIASLDDAQLADSGTVRHIAQRWISSHTAGADPAIRDKYDRVWLARVEATRRQRLAARKNEVRKEAAAQERSYTGPDDALFL